MAISTAVEEARQEFHAKQDALEAVLEDAWDGERHDLSKKSVLEALGVADRHQAASKVKQLNREIDDLGDSLAQREMMEVKDSIGERERARKEAVRGGEHVAPVPEGGPRTLGEKFIATKQYKEFVERKPPAATATIEMGIKTLFERTAGFAPESVRSGLVVPGVSFSLAEILDLVPTFPIDQDTFKFMQETTRTHAADATAEAGTYPESTFVFAEASSPVEKIADSIPATDEQLEDEGQAASLLDQRLRFGLRQKLASLILTGSGTSPEVEGILNVTGIQTQALGADSVIAAAYKAMTKVRFTGQAEPNAFVFHPNDWQDVVLAQEASGNFLWGHPSMGPVTSLWGLPVALSTGITENTALCGDFQNFCRLDERRGVMVEVGYVGTQFVEGKKTMRAQLRAAFTVTRPAAFCTITGI